MRRPPGPRSRPPHGVDAGRERGSAGVGAAPSGAVTAARPAVPMRDEGEADDHGGDGQRPESKLGDFRRGGTETSRGAAAVSGPGPHPGRRRREARLTGSSPGAVALVADPAQAVEALADAAQPVLQLRVPATQRLLPHARRADGVLLHVCGGARDSCWGPGTPAPPSAHPDGLTGEAPRIREGPGGSLSSRQASRAPDWCPCPSQHPTPRAPKQRGRLGTWEQGAAPWGPAGGHLRLCSGSPAWRRTRGLSPCGAETLATACPARPWRTSQRSSPGGECQWWALLPQPHLGPPCHPTHFSWGTTGRHVNNTGPGLSLEATESPLHGGALPYTPG